MTEAYTKPCQISKMVRHIENPGLVKAKQFIQAYSGTLSKCLDILRDIKAYSGVIEAY